MADQPAVPHGNCAPDMLKAIWTLFGICAIPITLRMVTAIKVLRRVTLSDYLMLGAFLLALLSAICTTISAHYGLGQHVQYLTTYSIIGTTRWLILGSTLAIMCPTLGRISFAVYMFQFVTTSPKKKWVLHTCIWTSLFINIALVVLVLAECHNMDNLWHDRLPRECPIDQAQANFGYFHGSFNSFIDLVLTILPILVIRTLNMPRKTKMGIMFLLGLSSFAVIASIFKTVKLGIISGDQDMSYAFCRFQAWQRVENTVVMVAASVPPCCALFRRRTPASKDSQGYTTGSGFATGMQSTGEVPTGKSNVEYSSFASNVDRGDTVESTAPTQKLEPDSK